jgi:Complex I intermediate-associated protein 30 (CIA30)
VAETAATDQRYLAATAATAATLWSTAPQAVPLLAVQAVLAEPMVQQAATEALQQRLVAALRCRAPQEVNHSPLFRGRFGDKSLGVVSCFGPVDEKLPSLMNGSSAIRIRATGDGKTYLFQLRGNDGTNYVQRFTSTAKKNQVYVLPLSDFTAVDWRLTEIAAPRR